MSIQTMTLDQIRINGLGALTRELGVVGMIRFLQQFETGHGDYTRDRYTWLPDADVATLVKTIQRARETRHKVE
jgi:hypothetical protein